jgi:hypothetical protein
MKSKFVNIAVISCLIFLFKVQIQAQEFKDLDQSPHDIVYFRENKISPPSIKVLYGRPQKNGRKINNELVPNGKIWRVGANEATEVKFYEDVIFGGEKVKAGSYVLYAIPHEKEWILILNSNLDVWGSYEYEEKYDIARAKAKVSKAEPLEVFSIGFKDKGNHVNMVLAWDTKRITVPIKIN